MGVGVRGAGGDGGGGRGVKFLENLVSVKAGPFLDIFGLSLYRHEFSPQKWLCYFSLLAVLWPHDKKYKKLVTLEILIWDKLMLFLVLFGGQLNFFLKKGLIIISE